MLFRRYGLAILPGSGSVENRPCVVFVHGLGGHVVDTWGSFLPLLAADPAFAGVDLCFFGYETTFLDRWSLLRRLGNWLPIARRYDFEAKSRELADEMRSLCEQRSPTRIILVGHSLGGLIILEALRQLVSSGEPKRLDTIGHISALVFYGTPFLGSDRVTKLAALASPDLRSLLRANRFRDALGAWVARQLFGHLLLLDDTYIRIGILYSARDQWVDIQSSQGRFPENLAEQWNVSHGELCKPADTSSRPYVLLRRFLVEESGPAAPPPETLPAVYRLRSADTEALAQSRHLYLDRIPPEEQVSWDVIVEALRRSEAAELGNAEESAHSRYLLVDKAGDGRVIAFAYAHHRHGHPYAWLAYLVAAKGTRHHLGVRLAAQAGSYVRQRDHDCKAFIFEVERPDAVDSSLSPTERIRRQARIRLYASRATVYVVADLEYRQPGLSPETTGQELPMYLLFAPVPGTDKLEWLTRNEVTDMLRWIASVQSDAYRNHHDASAYDRYLDHWLERMASTLRPSVRVKPARSAIAPT